LAVAGPLTRSGVVERVYSSSDSGTLDRELGELAKISSPSRRGISDETIDALQAHKNEHG
jgi:hypothetical protein